LDRRLYEPQSRSGRGGEEKSTQFLLGLEPPIIHPVAQRYTVELSRLVARIGDTRNAYEIFVGKLNGRDLSEDVDVDERIILE
jgi:hypothetical protein